MGSQRIFSASFAILSELCGQKPFACGQQNPLTAKNAKISARRSRRKTTLHRYSLLEATSQGGFASFAILSELCGQKLFVCGQQNPLAAKNQRQAKPRSKTTLHRRSLLETTSQGASRPLRTLASFAVKSSSPVTAKPFNREERESKTTLHRHSLLEATSKGLSSRS